jgi:hypothetical protein
LVPYCRINTKALAEAQDQVAEELHHGDVAGALRKHWCGRRRHSLLLWVGS